MNNKKSVVNIDRDIVESVVGAHCFFNDTEKVALWFRLENNNLGGFSPNQLINMGRAKKLAEFINDALESNKRKI